MPVSPAPWKKEKVGAAEVDLLHMTWPRNKSSRVAPAAHEEAAAAAATAMIPASSDPTMLNLSCRGLSSWPSAVHLDGRLVHLYLNDNELTELPEAIGRLRSLWQLFVHDNRLLELPASIGQLRALWELDAHSNQLTALPLSLAKCTSLRRLDVSDNLFSLTLSLGWLGKLRSLRLEGPSNPRLRLPPAAVVAQGLEATKRAFASIEADYTLSLTRRSSDHRKSVV